MSFERSLKKIVRRCRLNLVIIKITSNLTQIEIRKLLPSSIGEQLVQKQSEIDQLLPRCKRVRKEQQRKP